MEVRGASEFRSTGDFAVERSSGVGIGAGDVSWWRVKRSTRKANSKLSSEGEESLELS